MTQLRNRMLVAAVAGAMGLGAFVVAPNVFAQDEKPADKQPSAQAAQDPKALEHEMEAVEKAYRAMRRTVKDAAKADQALASLTQMQQHTVAAKGMIPALAASKPEAERADFVKKYRAGMVKLLRQQLDLEEQLLAGQTDKAQATYEAMKQTESEGHKEFKPKEH